MLVKNATLPWGQSWENPFPTWESQDCPHGEIRHSLAEKIPVLKYVGTKKKYFKH